MHPKATTLAFRGGGTVVLALLTLFLPLPGTAASGLDSTERLDAELDESFESGDWPASQVLLSRWLEARGSLLETEPLRFAAQLDDVAVRLFNAPLGIEAWLEAEKLFQRALEIRRDVLGEKDEAVVGSLETLSSLNHELGRFAAAEGYERRALELLAELHGADDPRVGARLIELGILLFKQGRYEEEATALDRASAILSTTEETDPAILAHFHMVRAELYRVLGRLDDAEQAGRESLALARRGGPEEAWRLAVTLNNLAGVYNDQGRYAEAESLYREVRAIWAADEFYFDLPTAYLNQAEIMRRQGRFSEAEPLFLEALELARERLAPDHTAVFLDRVAVQLFDEGSFEEAEPMLREALGILAESPETDPLLEAQSRYELARVLIARQRYAAARDELARVLEIRREALGEDHPEVSLALIEDARARYRQRAEVDDSVLDRLDEAIAVLERTTAFPEARVDAHAVSGSFLRRRGDLAGAIGSMETALGLIEAVRPRSGGTERTRAEFWSRYLDLFDSMVRWQLEAGRPERALEYTERARARVLLDQLVAARVDIRDGIPTQVRAELEERETRARGRVAESQGRLRYLLAQDDTESPTAPGEIERWEKELEEGSRELQLVLNEIRGASPLWREVVTANGRAASTEAIRDLVPTGGFLLVYQVGAKSSHLFVVGASETRLEARRLTVPPAAAGVLGVSEGPLTGGKLDRIFRQVERDLLDPRAISPVVVAEADSETGETARGLTRVADEAGRGNTRVGPIDRLHALWSVLIPSDLWPAIERAPEVVLVPDGALHRIPFEALVVDDGNERFWLDEGPLVRYAPSATALHNLEKRVAGRETDRFGSLLIVADPIYDAAVPAGPPAAMPARAARTGDRLVRLPGTAREANEIRSAFSGVGSVSVFERREATERNVRSALAAAPEVIHMATHGLVDERGDELLAGLALTPGPPSAGSTENDGFLQLFEIYDLGLDAELAVLSACQTQAGRYVAGEGVFALSRGFLAAGARRVVASVWAVDDESTAVLMGDFYRRLAAAVAAGEAPIYGEALREARRTVRERWPSPYHWAPFILGGLG